MRRLGRYEYENTLRDLFQLPRLAVAGLLPEVTKRHAFDINGLTLDIGNAHLNGYMDASDIAIAEAGAFPDLRGSVRRRDRHGQFLRKEAFTQNLYLTMLHKLGIEDDSWSNSTGDVSELG